MSYLRKQLLNMVCKKAEVLQALYIAPRCTSGLLRRER